MVNPSAFDRRYCDHIESTSIKAMIEEKRGDNVSDVDCRGNPVPTHLYHYKSLKYGFDEIINRRMWLSIPTDFSDSDPYDTWAYTLSPEVEAELREFGGDDAERYINLERALGDSFRDKARGRLRTVSMCDDSHLTNMWLEYAGEFGGICIEYLETDLFRCKFMFNKIEYKDSTPAWNPHSIYRARMEMAEASYVKRTEFSKEHEWRSVRILSDHPQYEPLLDASTRYQPAPKPCRVFIGYRARENDPDLFDRLVGYCREQGIEVVMVSMDLTHEG